MPKQSDWHSKDDNFIYIFWIEIAWIVIQIFLLSDAWDQIEND